MKTYLKRPYEKPLAAIYYSSSDTLQHFPSSVNFRQRIVQPSTKEQKRLLSLSSSSHLQHVHSGKYGIRPIWPSDESLCEQWQHGRKSSKHRSSSIASISSRSAQNRCLRSKSDLQKKLIVPSISSVSDIIHEHGSILLFTSISLLLLLLFIYFIYRRRCEQENEKKLLKQHRLNLESIPEPYEYRLPLIHALPTIIEENSPTLSPSNSLNKFAPLSTSTPSVVTGDSDSCNSSSTVLRQKEPSKKPIEEKQNIVHISLSLKGEPSSNQRRRSRFDQDSTENNSVPPVIVRKTSIPHQNVIRDDFKSLEEIDKAVKEVGLVRSQLIFGIDYTISNLETGKESFGGRSLHHIQPGLLNPYQNVISIIGRTLEKFDSDNLIPAFGFGDRATLDRKIFPLCPDGSYCKGFRGVLDAYNEITPKIRMSGPTNFAPLIREAIRIVKKTEQYHILVIVADGQVTNERQTKDAIVEASHFPLSIVMIGVGDGPWDMMEEFDDSLPTRQFDNFQFVNYNSVVEASANTDSTFALHALMEIPSQYAVIKKLGLLKDS
jgi:E3 ubiquitin-protein ligase RGLG